jgi:hypothetical protein
LNKNIEHAKTEIRKEFSIWGVAVFVDTLF